MKMAIKTINDLRYKFMERTYQDAFVAIDNSELFDDLNDACVQVREIAEQETWIFSDGSYITRNNDQYWTGENVDDFELVADCK